MHQVVLLEVCLEGEKAICALYTNSWSVANSLAGFSGLGRSMIGKLVRRKFGEVYEQRYMNGQTRKKKDIFDFQSKSIARNKGHYIVIKKSNYQEDMTILSRYTSDIGAPKYLMQVITELKREIRQQYNNSSGLQFQHWMDDPDRNVIRKHQT